MQLTLADTGEKKYLIDTSSLVTLDLHYSKRNTVFAPLWKEMEDLMKRGRLKTLDLVATEIEAYEGDHTFLRKWVAESKSEFVVELDESTVNASRPIIESEFNTGFLNARKQAEGKEEADPFLIAYCKVYGVILISNESKTNPCKIPKVAAKHGVKCISASEFIAELGFSLSK